MKNQGTKTCLMLFLVLFLFWLSIPPGTFAQGVTETMPTAPAVTPPPSGLPSPVPPAAQPKIDKGDTAWMLTSSALVLMMTIPGLFLFYGGLVRRRNVLGT
ncbi:MAG TPA: hypothetical protein VGK65_19555, partial [Candidatus Binatia bacterium]